MPAIRVETHYPDGEVQSLICRCPMRDLRAVKDAFRRIFADVEEGSFELVLTRQRHKITGAERWVPLFSACRSGYRVGFRLNEDGGVVAAYLEADE